MNTLVSRDNLLGWISRQIPETNRVFRGLPDQTNLSLVLNTLFDVTIPLIQQQKPAPLVRYLLIAEVLLTDGDQQVRNAVKTIYMYRLATVLYKQDNHCRAVYENLPPALRSEYESHNYPDE